MNMACGEYNIKVLVTCPGTMPNNINNNNNSIITIVSGIINICRSVSPCVIDVNSRLIDVYASFTRTSYY